MESSTKKVVILSSRFQNTEYFEENKQNIIDFLKPYIDNNKIIMGKYSNKTLINFLIEKGYEVDERNQHIDSVRPSNYKLIKEADICIFIQFNKSENIQSFIEYVNNNEKESYVLNITSN